MMNLKTTSITRKRKKTIQTMTKTAPMKKGAAKKALTRKGKRKKTK